MRQGGSSSRWRAIRGVVFRTYGDVCLICGDKATEVDHILEIAKGGTDDIENLQPLCSQCHRAKTAKFNSERLTKGKKNRNLETNGFFYGSPTPPTLSWAYLSLKPTIEPPISQKKEKATNDA